MVWLTRGLTSPKNHQINGFQEAQNFCNFLTLQKKMQNGTPVKQWDTVFLAVCGRFEKMELNVETQNEVYLEVPDGCSRIAFIRQKKFKKKT